MPNDELLTLLQKLIQEWENEVIEFKEASNNYDTDKIGKYFSALSNEANLRNQEKAWLVFGINNQTKNIVGTNYRPNHIKLQSLKMQITENTEPAITFRNIHELSTTTGRVILFEIPSAPNGMPISWKGHYYARAGESLIALSIDKQDEIRNQTRSTDWTAEIVPAASISDLDINAIKAAKKAFSDKQSNRFQEKEIMTWDDATFLERIHLTIHNQITRATILLLGKHESAHFLSPYPAQITWKLEGQERAYEHFSLPFLLTTTELYQKIRNYNIRFLVDKSLIPVDVPKYDKRVTLEALHNCIAHQDYRRNGRILVIEFPDRLVFENEGSFVEGNPEDYIVGNRTPRRYRNAFLVQAMSQLNMIDTMGYGIHSMNIGQAKRYLPLPDYDFGVNHAVKLTLYGSFLDTQYSQTLYQNQDLPLERVIQLDRESKTKVKTREETPKTREETREERKKTREEIISLIKEKPYITTEELSQKLNITAKGVEWQIQKLKKDGILTRIGSTKGGYWKVVSNETGV